MSTNGRKRRRKGVGEGQRCGVNGLGLKRIYSMKSIQMKEVELEQDDEIIQLVESSWASSVLVYLLLVYQRCNTPVFHFF